MTGKTTPKAKKTSALFKQAITPMLVRFPLVSNSKKPAMTGWANNPVKCQASRIYKHNNVGIITGGSVGLTIVDVDMKNDTMARFMEAVEEHGTPSPMYQTTPSGGLHYFFNYVPYMKTATYGGIDIRNDGGYVCTEGTIIDGKIYKIYGKEFLENLPPIPMWLVRFICENKGIHVETLIRATAPKKTSKKKATVCFTEAQMRAIMDGIPTTAWDDYSDWFKITCACKSAYETHPFMKDLWDEYSQKSLQYDATKNEEIWDSIVSPVVDVDYLNQMSETKTRLKYYKPYQAIRPDTVRELVHQPYLSADMYDTHATTLIKSATGTGKTVSVATYLKECEMDYLSIVSRISLAEAQVDAFTKHGLKPIEYRKMLHGYECPPQFITTIDSLRKYEYREDAEFILLLDEFSSLLTYLLTSETMNTHRRTTFKLFVRILKKAYKVIAIDADLNDLCVEFLRTYREDVIFIENTYQNAKGITAYEYEDKAEIYHLMEQDISKDEPFIMCSDSKDDAECAHAKMKSLYEDKADRFILHTADSEETLTNVQEKWAGKWVFYSPKVVYGVDYVPVEPTNVYMMAKTHTISPLNMAQQIARTRKIKAIHYSIQDTSKYPKYAEYKDAYETLQADFGEYKELYDNMGLLDEDDKIKTESAFLRWWAWCQFYQDTFSVRPKKHFQEMLSAKGFLLVSAKTEKMKLNVKELKQIVRDEKSEKYRKAIETPKEVGREYLEKLGERWDILGTREKSDMLVVEWVANDPFLFAEHMRVRRAMETDDKHIERLQNVGKEEFACLIPKSEAYKVQVLKIVSIRHPFIMEEEADKEAGHGISEEAMNEFKKVFRLKFTNEEVKTRGDLEQKRLKAMRQQEMFFGLVKETKKREQKQKDGVRTNDRWTEYSLCEKAIKNHLEVIAMKPYHPYENHELFGYYDIEPKRKIEYRFMDEDEEE